MRKKDNEEDPIFVLFMLAAFVTFPLIAQVDLPPQPPPMHTEWLTVDIGPHDAILDAGVASFSTGHASTPTVVVHKVTGDFIYVPESRYRVRVYRKRLEDALFPYLKRFVRREWVRLGMTPNGEAFIVVKRR